MKNKKLIGLASLMLALGGLAGCKKECEHDWVYKNDADGHWQVCSKCDAENTEFKKAKHAMKNNPDKEAENKAATCTEAGWTWQKCSACGYEAKKENKATGHHYTVKVSTTSTCTVAGKKTMKCKDCDATEVQDDVALDHDWVEDTTFTGEAATCIDAGTKKMKCNRTGCNETKIVDSDPIGHKWATAEKGTPVDNVATVSRTFCENSGCTAKKITFSALEVNENTKTPKRQGRAAVDDDLTTPDVDETAPAFMEPNYVVNSDEESVSFWGRPIGNDIVLNDQGASSSDANHDIVFNKDTYGSFLEYDFNLATDLGPASLIARMEASSYLGANDDVFKAGASDWTPGAKAAENEAGFASMDYRYEVLLDDEVVEWKDTKVVKKSGADWYTFPLKNVTLSAGAHKLTIRMGGGYLAKFFEFGFETPEELLHRGHTHNFVKDEAKSSDATCNAAGHYYGVCSCGVVDEHDVAQLTHEYEVVEGSVTEATCLTAGSQTLKCKLCQDEKTETINALGHNFVANGNAIEEAGYATINPQKCSRDNTARYVIDAKDVTDATKADSAIVKTAAVADDPNTPDVNEEAAATYEPNYTVNNDGSVKFYGRPIHNAMNLPATSSDHTSVYDATVVGSFIEYKFKVPAAIENVKLIAEIKPAQYMRQNNVPMFSNPASISDDWTPGLSADGEMYPTRYIVTLNGNVLEQDLSKDAVAASDNRAWYEFPLKNQLDFEAKEYTLRITMAGGYECSFYNIGIQTQDDTTNSGGNGGGETPHTHAFVAGDKLAADTDLREVACTCGEKYGYELQAADCTGENAPVVGSEKTQTNTRLGKNNDDDLWEINGLPKGTYDVYINAQTQGGNQNNYWNAGDDVANGGTSGNNGGAKAGDFAYRYTIAAGKDTLREAAPVGVAGKKYSETGIDNTAAKWSTVAVATISILDGDTKLNLHGNDNGYGIWVFGLRLVKRDPVVTVGAAIEGNAQVKTFTSDVSVFAGYELSTEAMTKGQVPNTSDAKTRLGKGTETADVWDITGIKAGKYAVYMNAQTKDNNQTAYWNAGDSVAHGDSAGNNGNAEANADAYRYKITVGETTVNVGLADTKYETAGITSAGGWTSVAVATITIPAEATTLTLANQNNGYAIWVYGLRLVQIA